MSSEADTRANYIDPALKAAHWQPGNIIREHYFTDGRKLAGGVRGRRCFVDYLLHKDNRYLAVVEAKKNLNIQPKAFNKPSTMPRSYSFVLSIQATANKPMSSI